MSDFCALMATGPMLKPVDILIFHTTSIADFEPKFDRDTRIYAICFTYRYPDI